MTLLDDLIAINTRQYGAQQAALRAIDSYLMNQLRKIKYDYSDDPKTPIKIFDEAGIKDLIVALRILHHEIETAQENGSSLNNLGNIAREFQIKWFNLLEENKISEKPVIEIKEEKSAPKINAASENSKKIKPKPTNTVLRRTFFHKNISSGITNAAEDISLDLADIMADYVAPDHENLLLAVDKFIAWMKALTPEQDAQYQKNNKIVLLEFLSMQGFNYIKTYPAFCMLANMLADQGFKTVPPATLADFSMKVYESRDNKYRAGNPLLTNEMLLLVGAELFDKHITKNRERYLKSGALNNPNKLFLSFFENRSLPFIKNYQQLCELAIFIQGQGYQLDNPPCTHLKFALMLDSTPFNSDTISFKPDPIPENIHLMVALSRFEDWSYYKDVNNNPEVYITFIKSTEFKYTKTYAAFCTLAQMINTKHSEIGIANLPCIDFAKLLDRYTLLRNMPDELSLLLAHERFSAWMASQQNMHEEAGHFANNNKALLDYLVTNRNFDYIKTYDQLCALADFFKNKPGWNLTNPPCTIEEFALHYDSGHRVLVPLPKELKLVLAPIRFDYWLKQIDIPLSANQNSSVLEFFTADSSDGARYISTYADLCELAILLKNKGYKITNPPCTMTEFYKAAMHVEKNTFGKYKFEISNETLLMVLADEYISLTNREKNASNVQTSTKVAELFADETPEFNTAANQELIKFILENSNKFARLDSYDYICEFSAIIKGKGFATTMPPCQLKTFDKLMDAIETKNKSNVSHSKLTFQPLPPYKAPRPR